MLSRRGYSHTRYAKARVVGTASTALLLTTERKKGSLAPLTTPYVFRQLMRRAEEVIVILLSGGRMDDGTGFVHQRSDKDR